MITITIRFLMTYASILAHSGNSKGLYPMIMGKKVNELISKAMMQMTLRMAPEKIRSRKRIGSVGNEIGRRRRRQKEGYTAA